MDDNTIGNLPTIPDDGGKENKLLANRYRIVQKLGEGGMGMVYLAEDTELGNNKVAIKFIPPQLAGNPRAIKNLQREAQTAMQLSHPNIVRLHDLHTDGHQKFLVMEYIEGKTLEQALAEKENDKLMLEELLPLADQIAAGLDYAHDRKVLHRDLKPSNIMIAKDGTVKLLDFGIAREMKDSFTRVTGQETSGTLPYMSPEQLMGEKPSTAMDIYSFGAVLYECLSGHPPFYMGDIREQIRLQDVKPIDGIGDTLNEVFKKSLAKQIAARPKNSREVVVRLASHGTQTNEKDPPTTTASECEDKVAQQTNVTKESVDVTQPDEASNCVIIPAKDLDELPEKYQWDRKKTVDFINNWSSKYLGTLSSMADRCEVLDIQGRGYFAWTAKAVVEAREWTEYAKGINVTNPSGPLEFLKYKPPRVPRLLSADLVERLSEICPDCHGKGEYICPKCFGQGHIQCPECNGIGSYVWPGGGYDHNRRCQVCDRKRTIPCRACKGVSRRLCASCSGTGLISPRRDRREQFPHQRNAAALWNVTASGMGNVWSDSSERLLADIPSKVEICGHCNGTGEYICENCNGSGEVQCSECEGIGAYVWPGGGYDHNRRCQVCNGAQTIPCQRCKGIPTHECEICRGSGAVAVYPTIVISRTINEITGTSVSGVGSIPETYVVPLATLDGTIKSVPSAATKLMNHFEGADTLSKKLSYSPKDKTSRIMRLKVELCWYPYMLCRMKNPQTSEEFVIGINCACKTAFRVQGKCPRGEGVWAILFGWASRPFDKLLKEEVEFMRNQLNNPSNQNGQETTNG